MTKSEAPKPDHPGPWPQDPDSAAIPPSTWAKKTGFRPKFSGETSTSDSAQNVRVKETNSQSDLENGRNLSTPSTSGNGVIEGDKPQIVNKKDSEGVAPKASTSGASGPTQIAPQRRKHRRKEDNAEVLPQVAKDDRTRRSHMRYELTDTPGLVPIVFYGLQQFISMLGSLVLTPLVIAPTMGGSRDDTATVVSTVLFVSGITTLLHTNFGSRLPLLQGPSFVFLAPALAIVNSPDFQGLTENSFKHIMRELQGAIILASAFQALLGYTGAMSILARLINPVVVSPTVAAIGLSFYSYGFPRVSTCLEIGSVLIILVIISSLYLRKISILGHRVFLIYAVPLGLAITWAIAFLLTKAGVYNLKNCDATIPVSNMVAEHCRRHVSRMKQCRVDTSHGVRTSPWFQFPYPLQWGTPIFHWKYAVVMCAASMISSVNSMGSYHATSLFVASRAPNPGVISRGIGLEGLSSIIAGVWGTGTGSTTLTENVHTIAVTRMGSRRAVGFGACILIMLSVIGKVGGFIASIPEVMVAALLCFMCTMLAALGLSNLRYSEPGSSRNVIIVGLSLFFSLTIPSYMQQYGISPDTNISVPSYFQPYVVATHGPIQSRYGAVNYVLNTLLSLHMVIAFLVAVILDNTVPGDRHERGVYDWTGSADATREPDFVRDYGLPFRLGRFFGWVKWVGI